MSQIDANQQAAGGGGAVTVADGADVAQGSTADALGANTVIGQLKKIASAGGSAVSIADGADVAQGATADAAITSDVAGTVSGKLRGLVKIFADVWDSVAHRLNVTVGNFPASQTVTQGTGSNLHVVVDTAPITAVTNAGLTNLDVALSTRTKPADQQHTIIDSASLGTVTVSGAVAASLAAETTKVIGTVNQGTSPWVTSTTLAAETTKVIGTVNISSGQAVALAAGAAVIGHVIVDSGSIAAAATLAAETTKVIGTVNISSGQSVALAAGAAVIGHVINDASTAVIGHVIVDSGSITAAATLAAETTKVIGTVNIASGQTLGLAAGSQVIGHVIVDSGTVTTVSTVTAVTSITNAVTVSQATPASLQATVTPIALTKGTQGATGFSVQELKDAGRAYVTMYAQLITGVTTEALATFTKNVNGTATTAQTAYTITSGKTFRIQTLFVRILNTTTVANNITVNVRVAASVAASSPIVFSCGASAPAAVAGVIGVFSADIPDGMEIAGNGTLQIGISHLENVTTASIASFTLTGYEY